MPILFDSEKQIVHLSNKFISYVIEIVKDKYITHRYLGKSLPFYAGSNVLQKIDRGFATNPDKTDRTFSLNALPMETSTQSCQQLSDSQREWLQCDELFLSWTHDLQGKTSFRGLA